MKEILDQLNQQVSLCGSMVMTPDGITVAAALGTDYEDESVAALVSSLVLVLKRGLAAFRKEHDMLSCTLHATRGRLLVVDMGNSYLVALAPRDQALDAGAEAVHQAIHKIKNRRVA